MLLSTLEQLAREPEGRFVAGRVFAHFCLRPDVWGVVLWGRPSGEDARELGRSLVLELAPPAERHVSLIDATRLEAGDERAFAALEAYVTYHAAALAQWVSRLALLRPPGLRGAIVAGAYEVVPRPYPVAVFDDLPSAVAWLALEDEPAAIAEMLEEMFTASHGTPPIVGALRALLDKNLHDLTLSSAARRLGTADRSLQRKLGEVGTTFQREVAAARVRAAERLLTEGDAPLTTIALDVGCASLQHFTTMFRKRVGMSPSAFRERARKARR